MLIKIKTNTGKEKIINTNYIIEVDGTEDGIKIIIDNPFARRQGAAEWSVIEHSTINAAMTLDEFIEKTSWEFDIANELSDLTRAIYQK